MLKIIGISGKKQAGKTTIAEYLNLFLPNSYIMGFADALKDEIVKAIFMVDIGKIDANKQITRQFIEDNKEVFRLLMKGWGDFRKAFFGNDYFVKQLDSDLMKLLYDDNANKEMWIIIPDVRFIVEVNFIRKCEGLIIRVDRPSQYNQCIIDLHKSETEMDKYGEFDYSFINDGTLDNLKSKVELFVKAQLEN